MVAIIRKSLPYLAVAGYSEAYFGLYLIYKHGVPGVAPDHMKAGRYLRRASKMGHSGSRVLMAFHYRSGKFGFSMNKRKASYWSRLGTKYWDDDIKKRSSVGKDILNFIAKYEFHGKDKIAIDKNAN